MRLIFPDDDPNEVYEANVSTPCPPNVWPYRTTNRPGLGQPIRSSLSQTILGTRVYGSALLAPAKERSQQIQAWSGGNTAASLLSLGLDLSFD